MGYRLREGDPLNREQVIAMVLAVAAALLAALLALASSRLAPAMLAGLHGKLSATPAILWLFGSTFQLRAARPAADERLSPRHLRRIAAVLYAAGAVLLAVMLAT